MKQAKSKLISTAIIDCGWKKQFVRYHLVLHGNSPYVASSKIQKIEKRSLPKPRRALTYDLARNSTPPAFTSSVIGRFRKA
jgi:hypothetical protein